MSILKVDVDLDFNSNDLYIESPTEIAGETTQEAGSALRVQEPVKWVIERQPHQRLNSYDNVFFCLYTISRTFLSVS